ncbi:MAG: M36 family metallopeptidase [Anaerolineae bacterium]|nr:M36 family metallopeptidase [Phycisphaerae bacterium]
MRSSRSRSTLAGSATFEQLERRQMLADAVSAVAGGSVLALPPEAGYVGAEKFFYKTGGYLTKPAAGDARDIATNWVRSNIAAFGLAATDARGVIVADSYREADSGINRVYLKQSINGLVVENTDMTVTLMSDGRILSAGGNFVSLPKNIGATPQLSVTAGLQKAAASLKLELARAPQVTQQPVGLRQQATLVSAQLSTATIPAEVHYVATSKGVKLAWEYNLDVPGGTNHYNTHVDAASGELLFTTDSVSYFVQPGTVLQFGDGTYTAPKGIANTPASGSPGLQAADYNAAYNVYGMPLASPYEGPRFVANNPWQLGPSPFGWHDTDGDAGGDASDTSGNNVDSHEDRDNNDTGGIRASGGALNPDGTGNLNFDFPIDFSQEPTTSNNQLAAITNLFYWNNTIHDIFYRYGFTEVARNFQQNNYGLGGAGNDRVQADAQDGGGFNNANFDSNTDGIAGRMQMYLFNAPTPDRDGDLDHEIVVHEYGHGISNRMTGTGSGITALQSRGMGEGWGDYFGLLLTLTDGSVAAQNASYGVGTYALGQAPDGLGVRRVRYSNDFTKNNQTFGWYGTGGSNGGSTAVHASGELWVGALWDMTWNLIRKHGFNSDITQGYDGTQAGNGNTLALKLVMDGIKTHGANPTFVQARDAILASDVALTGGANQKELWQAFSRRGLGINASTASSASTTFTENFDVPPALFDPFVMTSTPSGAVATPNLSTVSFTFDESMDAASFSVASDLVSFTGPGATDLTSQITGFTWTNSNRTLNITFPAQNTQGPYSLTIGPNILAADNSAAMDQDQDGALGESADDRYTASFSLDLNPGPDAAGYEASATPFQNIDLVIGAPGVTTLLNAVADTAGTIALPAGNSFTFYGTTYTSVSANPNGLIMFGTTTTSSANGDLTTSPTQAAIAVAWDNWSTSTTGPAPATDSAVLWRIDGNNLTIEWSDVTAPTSSQGTVTFQAILSLNTGTRNGDIIGNYVDMAVNNATLTEGASATLGIKTAGTAGANRLLVQQNILAGTFLGTGKAVRFTATKASGTVFADNNGDGVLDAGEAPLANAHIYADANNNGALDAGENATFADASGNYALTSLLAGANVLRIDSPDIINTQPDPAVNLLMGENGTNRNVGVFNTALVGTPGADILVVSVNGSKIDINHTFGQPSTYSILPAVLTKLSWDGLGGNDFVWVSAGPSLKLVGSEELSQLQIENNSSVFMPAGTNSLLKVGGLAMAPNATLDLGDNDMMVTDTSASTLSAIQALMDSARSGGTWSGSGITSTAAKNNAAHNTTLGAMLGSDYPGGTFNGQSVPANAVLVKYTYYGDTDFNGVVDFDDYSRVDAGFNNNLTGWSNGDADGNGIVDFDDYSLIDLAFNTQSGDL